MSTRAALLGAVSACQWRSGAGSLSGAAPAVDHPQLGAQFARVDVGHLPGDRVAPGCRDSARIVAPPPGAQSLLALRRRAPFLQSLVTLVHFFLRARFRLRTAARRFISTLRSSGVRFDQ